MSIFLLFELSQGKRGAINVPHDPENVNVFFVCEARLSNHRGDRSVGSHYERDETASKIVHRALWEPKHGNIYFVVKSPGHC